MQLLKGLFQYWRDIRYFVRDPVRDELLNVLPSAEEATVHKR